MNMLSTTRAEFVAQVKEELKRRADLNHDGRLTRQDIEVAVNYVHALTERETLAHPTAAVIAAMVFGVVVGYLTRALFGC